jgi:hypothetical protein
VLEGLDGIDWASLTHAYGRATDVPRQIRALVCADDELRATAIRQLGANIYHQGSRYEATTAAVPFLCEVLGDRSAQGKDAIIDLLVRIATGYPESHLPRGPNMDGLREYIASGLAEAALEWILDAYDAVLACVPRIEPLLCDGDDRVRSAATFALAWFRERASTSAPMVRAQLEQEQHPELRANAMLALALIDGYRQEHADSGLFAGTARGGGSNVVTTAAAIALATVEGGRVPEDVLALLVRAVQEGDVHAEGLRWNNGDLSGYAAIMLRSIGAESVDHVASPLCAALSMSSGMQALNLTSVLLGIVFSGSQPPERRAIDLSATERRILLALAKNEAAWRVGGHPHASFALLMRDHGLPGSAAELAAFLGA